MFLKTCIRTVLGVVGVASLWTCPLPSQAATQEPVKTETEGAFVNYHAVVQLGKVSFDLGNFQKLSDCTRRLVVAGDSAEFNRALQHYPIAELACVATRRSTEGRTPN